MKKELELFLRNARIVNQTNVIIEKDPYRFMRQGLWVTQYIIHLNNYVSGLSLRGVIENYENGVVETKLVYSRYGDLNLSLDEQTRREKIITHIRKYGATYKEEPPIRWFN